MMIRLKKTQCHDCGKPILVADYIQHPDQCYVTGHPLYGWDAEKLEEYFRGYVCDSCMNNRYLNGATISGPELMVHDR